MTTPTEFTPTPEQVTVMILQIRQACPWYLELQTVAWLARWHLTELYRETETLRSQLDALKAQVVVKDEALKEFYGVYESMPGCSLIAVSRDRFIKHKQALAQLSPK
jgi:hypothetical protein